MLDVGLLAPASVDLLELAELLQLLFLLLAEGEVVLIEARRSNIIRVDVFEEIVLLDCAIFF